MKKTLLTLFVFINAFATPQIGDYAIPFKLPDLYNLKSFSSNDDFRGKVVLLNLWASWCSGCKDEMPRFVQLQKELRGTDFKILLSNIDNDSNNAIEFLNQVDKNRTLSSLYDKEKTLPKSYQCFGMPSSYLIDKNGKIVDIFVGSLDNDSIQKLQNEIKNLLGQK